MNDPFRQGGQYRNRLGSFQVVSIHPPSMTIRYADGTTADVNIAIQARIWGNILLETEATSEEDLACLSDSQVIEENQFGGLRATDFKKTVSGTCWRAKNNLGGLLALRLTDKAAMPFVSVAIYRRPQVYIVRPECYNAEMGASKAKLFVALDEVSANFGLTVEKSDLPMPHVWDWPRLLRVLREDREIQTGVLSAMILHDLAWDIHLPSDDEDQDSEIIARVSAEADRLAFHAAGSQSSQAMTWEEFVDYVEALPEDSWAALCLCRHLRKAQAISMGAELGEQMADLYRTLVPLYVASTCPI